MNFRKSSSRRCLAPRMTSVCLSKTIRTGRCRRQLSVTPFSSCLSCRSSSQRRLLTTHRLACLYNIDVSFIHSEMYLCGTEFRNVFHERCCLFLSYCLFFILLSYCGFKQITSTRTNTCKCLSFIIMSSYRTLNTTLSGKHSCRAGSATR